MEQNFGGEFPDAIREFRLPAYDEIPDTGLYLEQAGTAQTHARTLRRLIEGMLGQEDT